MARRSLAEMGLPDGQLVWVAVPRRGIVSHHFRAGDSQTPCGRNQISYGTTACVVDAVDLWAAGACPACFGEPFIGPNGPVPGYVVGLCGHRVARSEWWAGFVVCERCPDPGPRWGGA